jgi:hypothetical protein
MPAREFTHQLDLQRLMVEVRDNLREGALSWETMAAIRLLQEVVQVLVDERDAG